FQFREAELVEPNRYLLSGRLRGQAGSDGLLPAVWPVGSMVVLLDGRQAQIDLTPAQRRVARHYRIGPARRGYSDPSYQHLIEAFEGNGLRPYAPCHLTVTRESGAYAVGWIRRTRMVDGSDWALDDVPLGEESEAYLVRVMQGATVLRQETLHTPQWSYGAAAQAADGLSFPARLEVAQISARYGPGLFARVDLPE
ncbi:MAG: host specificity protein, partial [Pseudodonghicola sp.]|nr:host specificity protein [Pseudodonghicola sp.]